MDSSELIFHRRVREFLYLARVLCEDSGIKESLLQAARLAASALLEGNKIMSCGNGGSMAQAIHLAEELSGRYREDRPPLAAMAISDPGHLSCVANDYGYDMVFSRFVEALGRRGDVLVLFTTSGSSPNLLCAAEAARLRKMHIVAFTGASPNPLTALADVEISTPSGISSAGIQEWHALATHIFVEILEKLFKK